MGSGIRMQSSADTAGNADEHFQPGQAFAYSRRDHMAQLCATARKDLSAGNFDPPKCGSSESHHHSGHTFVADQHVRSATKQTNWQVRLVAAANQSRQFLDVSWLREIRGIAP